MMMMMMMTTVMMISAQQQQQQQSQNAANYAYIFDIVPRSVPVHLRQVSIGYLTKQSDNACCTAENPSRLKLPHILGYNT